MGNDREERPRAIPHHYPRDAASDQPLVHPSPPPPAGQTDATTLPVTTPYPVRELHVAVQRWRGSDTALGQHLLVLGTGPIPISDAVGAVGLDREGTVVFVAALGTLTARSVTEIVDHMDRIAQLGSAGLDQLETDAGASETIAARHARFFDLPRSEKPAFNRAQQAVVLVEEPPTEALWKVIVLEFGPLLGGIFRVGREGAEVLRPPDKMLRPSREVRGTWPLINWIGLLVVLLGTALGVLGIARVLDEEQAPPPVLTSVESPIREVVTEVGADATHTQWIGQQRSVRTARGNVLFLFPNQGSLQLVADQGNQGRTWRTPITVTDIGVDSFSVAIDARDRIHVAFQGPSGTGYTRLKQTPDGWEAQGVIPLDTTTTSDVVDIAWDASQQIAHVVWVEQGPRGEQVSWAALRYDGGEATVVDEVVVSEEGDEQTALATVDIDPTDSEVLITYRAPDEPNGWYSKILDATSSADWELQAEERLPIDEFVGAASVAFDRRGTTHLILRDSTDSDLEYFRRTDRAGWTSSEVVVDATSIEHIDLPTLAVDDASRLIYLFFHSDEFNPAYEVRMAIKDPASGWEGPFEVASPDLIPEGASFPTTLTPVDGQALVFWTRKGSPSGVQLARITAP